MPKRKSKEEIIEDKKTIEKFSLEDIEGIGAKRLERLRNAGITKPQDLIIRGVKELSELTDINADKCSEIISNARKFLENQNIMSKIEINGLDLLNYRTKTIQYLDTGANNLNEILSPFEIGEDGGFESGVLTELYGEYGSGKTQVCMLAAILAQLPYKRKCFKCQKIYEEQETERCPDCDVKTVKVGGLSKKGEPCRVVYIDSENSVRGERMLEMIYERELVPVKEQTPMEKKMGKPKEPLDEEAEQKAFNFLHNIVFKQPRFSGEQVLIGEKLGDIIEGKNCGHCSKSEDDHEGQDHEFVKEQKAQLLIIDSFTKLFREEYGGRGNLSDRQMIIGKHIMHISRMCEIYNVIGLFTNQVMKDPGAGMFGDPTRPIGGMQLAHTSTHRIYLRKGGKSKVIANLVDSPNKGKGEAVLQLTEKGIEDGE